MTGTRIAMAALLLAASHGAPVSAQPAAPICPMPAAAAGGPINAHSRNVERNLRPAVLRAGEAPGTLADAMRRYEVPGISVAVIRGGKLAWARGWGVRDLGNCAPVTPNTVFQAASISKTVTAMLALRLVEQGKIGLDRDINEAMRTWRLPADPKLAPRGVTLREVLSHSAGLGVHGFAGYAPGAPLPSPVQILDGAPPSNSPAVRSELPAGHQFQYSGGGYVLAQVALRDAGGLPFAELARREIFGPLGMTRSDFAMPPSSALLADIAYGSARARPIAGNYRVYPELGPAGLWTSASDLARVLIDLQAAVAGKTERRLSPAMARAMMTPVKDNWGMGVALYTDGPLRFGHDGLNEGYQSFMIAYARKGDGIVVLTNGGDGRRLIGDVVRAIATEYGWPEIAAPATREAALSLAALRKAAGHFEGGGLSVDLEARSNGLFAHAGGPSPERLIALSPHRFRSETMGLTCAFAPDFSSCTIVEGGPPMKLVRTGPALDATR